MTIKMIPGMVYDIAYRCRDMGYGVEEGIVFGFWTGETDTWGKHTICPTDGNDPLYLFTDEILEVSSPYVQEQV